MRYWYDTEFIEDGKTIELISIGIVCEDGREYYAQANWFNPVDASNWIWVNVFPLLKVCYGHLYYPNQTVIESLHVHKEGRCTDPHCPWRTREEMRDDILAFMNVGTYGEPELWGYYSAYDHVVFCQIFGTMIYLPFGFPMYTRDIKQWCDMLGNPVLPEQDEGEHHALADARWNKQAWEFLRALDTSH